MPYLKGNHAEALRIHEEYQSGNNDQAAFLVKARDFLVRDTSTVKSNGNSAVSAGSQPSAAQTSTTPKASTPAAAAPGAHQPLPQQPPHSTVPSSPAMASPLLPQQHQSPTHSSHPMIGQHQIPPSSLFQPPSNYQPIQTDSIFSPLSPATSPNPVPINPPLLQNHSTNQLPSPQSVTNHNLQQPPQQQQPYSTSNLPSLPPDIQQPQRDGSFDGLRMSSIERGLDALMTEDDPTRMRPTLASSPQNGNDPAPMTTQEPLPSPGEGHLRTATTQPLPISPPRNNIPDQNKQHQQQEPRSSSDPGALSPWSRKNNQIEGQTLVTSSLPANQTVPPKNGAADDETPSKMDSLKSPPPAGRKEAPPPRRLWTHPQEQPGRILVKGHGGEDYSFVLPLGPREELTAHWGISLDYLRKYATEKFGANASLETVLSKMTLGLFRRGCTENGMQASIVSKSVLGEFWKDPASRSVRGKVPFFSPRTPGHVVFRLFWEENPLYTLASGPTILVRVLEQDFESSVRFILSNFKGKKSNPTSLSSLHSLATILETPISRPNESAARATWGCIQEARKVLDACAQEHEKTIAKLSALEKSVEELKKQVDAECDGDGAAEGAERDAISGDEDQLSEAALSLKEKTRTLMSGRASCERKWRDSQLAFAGILRAVVSNQAMTILLRRELILKMRIEYELWCPLSEEFAIIDDNVRIWYEPLRELPQSLTAEDFDRFSQARKKMQLRTVGFDPNTLHLGEILFPQEAKNSGQRALDPDAVTVFNKLSSAMGQLFQEVFHDEAEVLRRRELVRKQTEEVVNKSGIFPPDTKVVIFGSSANGFGTPNSDLDMCLQLPDGKTPDDLNGTTAMSQLAEFMAETGGMADVDTARLAARIPVVMYRCPNPLSSSTKEGDGDDKDEYVECDLSMHNPLAVLNTQLLYTYAQISPIARLLSLVIKRWAKARDINNPARHTLSSYGYIIMLLHFLTFHKRSGNGLVSPVARPEGDRNHSTQRPNPLLPNLQWMDPAWPGLPRGTPYRELPSLPPQIVMHPLEEGKRVNRHFYRSNTPNETALLQMHFMGNDLSLAILLASFFRYYAYEFDYKRFVVSLHSTATRGMMEREVKAELDGWRNYSAALTIEDPFETFYDVAHVLRGGYYHRIRREFAVAYSKIADAAAGRPGSWNKGDLRQALSGEELIDWICEPIEKERATSEEDS